MAGDKEPFSRWLIGVVAVPIVVALISAGYFAARSDDHKASTATTAAAAPPTTSAPPIVVPPAKGGAEVRACMVQHQMNRAITTSTTLIEARGTLPHEDPEKADPDFVSILQRCDWPRQPWSDGDGYSEIRVQSTIGPGQSEATSADVADIITSSCTLLEVRYSIAAQGYQEPLPAFTSKPNRPVYSDGKPYRSPPAEQLNFYYDDTELVVLRDSKIKLDRVRCVK